MVRNGEITLLDVKRVARRYWWIVAATVAICTAGAITVSFALPKRYTSQTMIEVKAPTVDPTIMKGIASGDMSHRLSSMQDLILSRARLQPVIDKLNLYPKLRGKVDDDELVERLRTAVKIIPMEATPGTENRQLPGFFVSVDFDNPERAQQICNEITSMFIAESDADREVVSTDTTQFLNEQLEKSKQALDEQDAKLAEFKKEHLQILPEDQQTNLSLLTGMNSQLDANTQALSRAQQDLAFNQSLLASQEMSLKGASSGVSPESTETQLSALREQLATLLGRYTPQHPDVVKVQSQIAELEKRQASAPKTAGPDAVASQASYAASPQIQQLKAKIRQSEVTIADLTRRQGQIQAQLGELQGRLRASPGVEQQYKELTRNYQTALDFYNDLLKKQQTSSIANDLQHQKQSEQFRMVDAPSYPDKPSFPNKPIFAAGGLGMGLALGLGILYALAFSDKSLHTEKDVETFLKVPVLALIPTLDLEGQRAMLSKPRGGLAT
jgi:polysaccharide chain length determinant protein (PEP-CTERM system associated)